MVGDMRDGTALLSQWHWQNSLPQGLDMMSRAAVLRLHCGLGNLIVVLCGAAAVVGLFEPKAGAALAI